MFADHGSYRRCAVTEVPGADMRVEPTWIGEFPSKRYYCARIGIHILPRVDGRRNVEHRHRERIATHATVLVTNFKRDRIDSIIAPCMAAGHIPLRPWRRIRFAYHACVRL